MSKKSDNASIPSSEGISESDLKLAGEMEKEGKTIPPDLKAALDASKAAAGGAPAADESKEAVKTEEKPALPVKKEDEPAPKVEPAADDKSKDDKGQDAVIEPPKPRGVQSVPLAKYLDTERQKNEAVAREVALKAQLDALPGKSDEDYEAEVSALAETLGLEIDQVKSLDAFFAKRHKLPDEVVATLKDAQQQDQQKVFWDGQNQSFDKEFAQEVDRIKATDPEEAALMEANKEAIKQLAFTEGYTTKSTWEIFTRHVKPDLEPDRKTVEVPADGSAGTAAGSSEDWATIERTPGAILKLSPEQFKKYDEWKMSQGSDSGIRRAKRA